MTRSTDIRLMIYGDRCERMARVFADIRRWQEYGIPGTVTVDKPAPMFMGPHHVNTITLPRLTCLDDGGKST